MEAELITVDEICRRLAVSKFTVYWWAKAGRIPHYRLGRNLRFSWADILAWLEKNRRESA